MLIPELTRIAKTWFDLILTCSGIVVYYCGLARLVIGLHPRSPRVLMYHACEEAESDFTRGLSINTTPARFAAQLDFLRKYYRVVSLESLGGDAQPDRAVVITFDDGFRSVYEHALPLLRARSLPATCYLVTDRIDDPSTIWINELNGFLQRHRAVTRRLVAHRLGISRFRSTPLFLQAIIDRYDPVVIAGLLAELRTSLGSAGVTFGRTDRLYIGRHEIEEMSRDGFTFGNHTGSHAVLPRLDEAACREEIRRAQAVLGGLPRAIASLAYPFGRCDESVRGIARELGYTTLMEVEGDNDPLDRLHVGRLNVNSCSPAVLFARMEVVARIKPRMKRFLRGIRHRIRG
jgi:peptidoglycan/xylan/chitin deacetylase (PgdA/CDA1 family)